MRAMFRIVALSLAAALLISGVAAGNDAVVGGSGGGLVPLRSADVRMEAETVQAIVYNGYAHVRVDFKFVNRGDPQTFTLGFPFGLAEGQQLPRGVAGFQAWVDGRRVPVRYSVGRDGPNTVGYYTHEVAFKTGTTMVRVEYLVDASVSSGGLEKAEIQKPAWHTGDWTTLSWYPYWVHTGAGWAGTIGKTVVRFRLADDCAGFDPVHATQAVHDLDATDERTVPGPVALDDRTLQWCFEDYEPSADAAGESAYDVTFALCEAEYPDMARSQRTPVELRRWLISDAAASSELEEDSERFWALNAFSSVGHPWAESAPGPGKGEWVEARFGAARPIEEIRVVSGRAQRPDLFEADARPKTLKVTFSDGSSQILSLKDTPALQRFIVPKKTSTSVKVEIVDVYPGRSTQDAYLTLVDAGLRSPAFEGFDELLASASDARASDPSTRGPGAEDATAPAPATSDPRGASSGTATGETGGGQGFPIAYAAAFAAFASAAGYVAYRRKKRSSSSSA